MGELEGDLFGSHSGSGLCGGCSRGETEPTLYKTPEYISTAALDR